MTVKELKEQEIDYVEGDIDEVIDAAAEDSRTEAPVPFYTLNMDNGNRLEFYETRGSNGDGAVFVLEEVPDGNPSITRISELSADALELFNAVSLPGTPVPEELARLHGDKAKLGPRGWFINQFQTQNGIPSPRHPCNPTQFTAQIESYHFQKTLTRLHERPVDHPARWTPYHDCLGIPGGACNWTWYRYTAKVFNVDLFYTAVAVCTLDYHPTFCTNYGNCYPHVGPKIIFRYRDADNQPGIASVSEVSNTGAFYHWLFYTGPDWDWFTEIRLARPYDRFHIGLTWSRF